MISFLKLSLGSNFSIQSLDRLGIKREEISTVKGRTKFPIVYPGDNEAFTRIQGLNPSSTCIPLQGERRQDDTRRHSDLYSFFPSLFTGQPSYYLPELSAPQTLDSCRVETQNRLREYQTLSLV
jgi:hypothetical protein